MRSNYSKQMQIQREPDVKFSIFDEDAFKFYLIKYAEVFGLDSLLIGSSHDRTMSYDQKRKIIDFILKTELKLGVVHSSWKHCLLFMYHNGSISYEELMDEFTTPEAIEKAKMVEIRAETFDSVEYTPSTTATNTVSKTSK